MYPYKIVNKDMVAIHRLRFLSPCEILPKTVSFLLLVSFENSGFLNSLASRFTVGGS